MKKFLSLVMALIMTMSLVTVASAADYKDAADVSFKEAVDVMSAVGVFQGADGKFSPKANLTREQAAKLIAYLDLGEKAAEALPAVQSFSDVPATRWSAKYVAYCADAGYINGVGNGKFNPAGELTGYAFGKMLLCTLGFDASIEAFTGANWTIAVAKLMNSNDINDGVKTAPSAVLTREQAAQYCLNALKADTVEYEDKGTSISINGAVIATGASKAKVVADKKGYEFDHKADGILQLAEKLYGKDLKKTTDFDVFNAPATTWTYKTEEVDTYVDAAEVSYEGKAYSNKVYDALGKTLVENLQEKKGTLTVYVDGEYKADLSNPKKIVKDSTDKLFKTAYGMVTDIYVGDYVEDANEYDDVIVVVKNTYVVKAEDDYNANLEKLDINPLNVEGIKTEISVDDFAEITDVKKDDYLLVTVAKDKIQSIAKAEVVTGEVTDTETSFDEDLKKTVNESLTLGGLEYKLSAKIDVASKTATFHTGKTAVVVLDAQECIIYVDDAEKGSDDIVFVKELYKDGSSSKAVTKAIVVTMDGKEMTVTVDTKDSDKNVLNKTVEGKFTFCGFAYFTVDGEKYELTKVTYADSHIGDIANRTTKYNKKTVNSETVLVVYNVADEEYSVYTGVKNIPNVDVDVTNGVQYVFDGSKITYMYTEVVDADAIEEPTTDADDLFVVVKVGTAVKNNGSVKYTETKIVTADGTEKTLKVKPGFEFTLGAFYKSMKVDADNVVSTATMVEPKEKKYATLSIFADKKDQMTFDEDVLELKNKDIELEKEYTDTLFVENDKALVIIGKGVKNLLKDDGATFEKKETTLSSVVSMLKGYYVEAHAVMTLNSDNDVTSTIFVISKAEKTAVEYD